jgi:NADH-quinone oxidoreductase subunit I
MPIKKEDVVWVEEPQFGLLDAMYLPAIAEGVRTTLKHLFRPEKVTEEYPEQKPELPPNYRGVHRLNRDDQGRVKCVACFLCATACPARCIEIIGDKAPWADRDKYPTKFVIDELKCIYCGMCEEACPVDAIELTSIYDLTGKSRQEMLFDREKLLSIYDQTVASGHDPKRTRAGVLGPASHIVTTLLPAGGSASVANEAGPSADRGVVDVSTSTHPDGSGRP